MHVTVEPLEPLGAASRWQVTQEAERVGQSLEGEVSSTIGTVGVGPHA